MLELPTGEPHRGSFGNMMQEQLKLYAQELSKLKGRKATTA
jgi:hypothetical protein